MNKLLKELIKKDAKPVFLTGAGISHASGIPTFRGKDEGAIWSQDVLELATLRYFKTDPLGSWNWYRERFSSLEEAEPNEGHKTLASLSNEIENSWVVTQNIDGLQGKVSTKNLIEIHGNKDLVRCTNISCIHGYSRPPLRFVESLKKQVLPVCPQCRFELRPHVLWFDESYISHPLYRFPDAMRLARDMTCLVLIGTSNSVNITKIFLDEAYNIHAPVFNIDPYHDLPGQVHNIREKAEEFLPNLYEEFIKLKGS